MLRPTPILNCGSHAALFLVIFFLLRQETRTLGVVVLLPFIDLKDVCRSFSFPFFLFFSRDVRPGPWPKGVFFFPPAVFLTKFPSESSFPGRSMLAPVSTESAPFSQ